MLLSNSHKHFFLLISYLVEYLSIEPPKDEPVIVLLCNLKLRKLQKEFVSLFYTMMKESALSDENFGQEIDRIFTQSNTKAL